MQGDKLKCRGYEIKNYLWKENYFGMLVYQKNTRGQCRTDNVSGYPRNPCSLNRERDAAWAFTLWERLLRDPMSEALIEIMPIHWLMARCRPWRTHIVSLYCRTRHPLLRFLCRKESCRQREELGSKRSVSFPIQRTRVTWVTRDVLFHRFTYAAWAFTLWERYTKHAKIKTLPIWSNNEPKTYGRFKQTGSENLESYQSQGCKTWQRCAERTILPQHKYPPGVPL